MPPNRDPATAIVVASLAFGLMHLPINTLNYGLLTGLSFCIGINAVGGCFLGYLYHRTGSLTLVVFIHYWSGLASGIT